MPTYSGGSPVSSPSPLTLPSSWAIEIGHRYVKHWLQDKVPAGEEPRGVTQDDINAAQIYAWRFILSRLVGAYDVSDWSTDPPHPLFEIWDLLASSYVLELVASRVNATEETSDLIKIWFDKAEKMLKNILDPDDEGDRMHLLEADGSIQHRRLGTVTPVIVNTTGVQFWPRCKSYKDSFGNLSQNSVQAFIEERQIDF